MPGNAQMRRDLMTKQIALWHEYARIARIEALSLSVRFFPLPLCKSGQSGSHFPWQPKVFSGDVAR
jgi:hypothetical protein